MKSLCILAACGVAVWKMAAAMFGPAVTPGEVAMLTAGNFQEVRKDAGTLLALYTRPG